MLEFLWKIKLFVENETFVFVITSVFGMVRVTCGISGAGLCLGAPKVYVYVYSQVYNLSLKSFQQQFHGIFDVS